MSYEDCELLLWDINVISRTGGELAFTQVNPHIERFQKRIIEDINLLKAGPPWFSVHFIMTPPPFPLEFFQFFPLTSPLPLKSTFFPSILASLLEFQLLYRPGNFLNRGGYNFLSGQAHYTSDVFNYRSNHDIKNVNDFLHTKGFLINSLSIRENFSRKNVRETLIIQYII